MYVYIYIYIYAPHPVSYPGCATTTACDCTPLSGTRPYGHVTLHRITYLRTYVLAFPMT